MPQPILPGKSTIAGKTAGSIDAAKITNTTAQFATPGAIVLLLVMGNGYFSEREELDTQLRIHVELLDNRLASLEEAQREAEEIEKQNAAEQSADLDELKEDLQGLRQCVIAPKRCK